MKTLKEYLITEKLHINKDINNSEKLNKLIKELCEKHPKPSGMWANGKRLHYIAKNAADIFGETTIKINVPYHDFNCLGSANKIYDDVYGLIPFSKNEISEEEATTLFYGKTKIKKGNYLPFQAQSDAFYIKDGKLIDGIPTFDLEKYYESFM